MDNIKKSNIPDFLCDEKFRFILLAEKSKLPLEDAWQSKNYYDYKDEKLLRHLESGGNYGVLSNFGSLRILDIDDIEVGKKLQDELNTLTVKTCGNAFHFYFISDYDDNHKFKEGELRSTNAYVVGPNCYAIDKKKGHEGYYSIINNKSIRELKKDDMSKLLVRFLKDKAKTKEGEQVDVGREFIDNNILPKLDENTKDLILTKAEKGERSEIDQRVITFLLLNGFGKYIKSIFKIYPVGEKYREHSDGEAYIKYCISKGREYTGVYQDEIIDLEKEINALNASVLRNKLDEFLNKIAQIKSPLIQEFLVNKVAFKITIKSTSLLNKLKKIIKEMRSVRQFITVGDLLDKDFPAPQYWIHPIIPKNSMIFVGGRPDSFKSLFMLFMAIQSQISKKVLGEFEVNQKPKILYYDLENGEKMQYWRIKYLISGQDINEQDKKDLRTNFHIQFNFDKMDIEKEVELAKKYDIIIMDSYRRFLEGAEDKSEIVNEFYDSFLKKLREMEKTIIIIHHFRKQKLEEMSPEEIMDSLRGSGDIGAQPDIIYGLFKVNESIGFDGKVRFDVSVIKSKSRDIYPVQSFAFSVLRDDELKQTLLKFREYGKILKPKERRQNRIIELLKEKGTLSKKEILDVLRRELTSSEGAVDKDLQEMIDETKIIQPKHGSYSLPTVIDIEKKQDEKEQKWFG